jgi:bacillopeptidase F (M6 metalloprotease family)
VAIKVSGPPAYDPPDGAWYAYSDRGSSAYKRLQTTVDLTGKSSGALTFTLSHSTEPDFDYVFVEAHTVGQEDWTTLADRNGNTSDDTGAGCPDDDPFWLETHPFLRHYITRTEDPAGASCAPTGSSGTWNAATGNSNGFHDWNVDLAPFAGRQVELSITYITDPAVQGLGVFLDNVRVTSGSQTLMATSFEDGTLSPFTVGAPPAGSGRVFRNWQASRSKGFEDGPGVRTERSLLLGFGLEGVTGAANRGQVLKDGLGVLGVTP